MTTEIPIDRIALALVLMAKSHALATKAAQQIHFQKGVEAEAQRLTAAGSGLTNVKCYLPAEVVYGLMRLGEQS